MIALALVSLSLSAVSAAKLEDLGTGPLSLVLRNLNEADGPKVDLDTMGAVWTLLGDGLGQETAAVFKNTRLEIRPETLTSVEMLNHQRPCRPGWERFQVDTTNLTISTPYLQYLPAVSKAVCDECRKLTNSILFEGVSPDMRISPDPNRDFSYRSHVSSPEAQECVDEVLREMLGKFDWSHDVSHRRVRDGGKNVAARHLCAGESYFTQNSYLLPSLPFSPIYRGEEEDLCQVILKGDNNSFAIRPREKYQNFLALHLSEDTMGYTLTHHYPNCFDGVLHGRNPDGSFPSVEPRWTPTNPRCYPYANYLHTELKVGATMIERHSSELTHRAIHSGRGIGIPQREVIQRVRRWNQDFLEMWQEQEDVNKRDNLR